MADKVLPEYEPMLEAYHTAFAGELRMMIQSLPIVEGNLVLEMACGDGVYTPWLMELAGRSGGVVGLDVSPQYLALARDQASDQTSFRPASFVTASIERLPFADRTFDAVWCAQSLFSLPEPIDAVTRMARVAKPGGLVAVLEDDTLHQVLLPWPVEVELAVRAAEWDSLREESPHPEKFYVGRQLARVFRESGLVEIQIRSFANSRIGPFAGPIREFLGAYLSELRDRVVERIDPKSREILVRLIDEESPNCLLDQADLQLTVIDHVVLGRVPGGGAVVGGHQ